MKRRTVFWLVLPLAMAVAGCEAKKSSNPLSPSVAGPIPGVNITVPQTVDPSPGTQIEVSKQPITLTVQNASTSGVRPLSYSFEVATDAGFGNKVFSRDGVAAGDGKTSLRLPDPLTSGKTYYWHARAQDGANTGAYSTGVPFSVYTAVVLQAPVPVKPGNGASVSDLLPTFAWNNAGRTGPAGNVTYTVQVAADAAFGSLLAIWQVNEQPNQTSLAAPGALQYATTYYWRVEADDPSGVHSPWSTVFAFATPPVPAPPPPTGGGGGGGGGPVGNWQQCAGIADHMALVQCVHSTINPVDQYGDFEVVKRVAWLLRGEGAGELIKNGGDNIVSWMGYSFSASRVCYPDGHIYKIITDAGPGGANGPTWSDNGYVDRGLYVAAINPGS